MKIAYLIESIAGSGGMERVLFNKTNYLINSGFDITVITTGQAGRPTFFEFDPRISIIDLDIRYGEYNEKSLPKRLVAKLFKWLRHKKRLCRLLNEEKFDIVISMFGDEIYWLTNIKDGSHKVAEIHFSKFFRYQLNLKGVWRLINWCQDKLDNRSVRRMDKFIILSSEDRAFWPQNAEIDIIYNHVPFNEKMKASLQNKRAIAIGRLVYQKGFDKLIEIWNIVYKKHPDWKLDIFGDGDDYQRLQDMIASYNLVNVINICKPVRNIDQQIRESSIYLLSSNYEGLPMVLLESMSEGVPAVAFTCKCGPRDIITDGVDGFLVNEGDIEQFADKVCVMIENEELRQTMGIAAKLKIKSKFTEDKVMPKWIDLFNNIKLRQK